MHQIRFRPGLRPRPKTLLGEHSPDLLAGFKGPTSKGMEGRKDGGKSKGGKREGRGTGRRI